MNNKHLKYIYNFYGMITQEAKLEEEIKELNEAYIEFVECKNTFTLRKLLLEICDYLNMFQQVYSSAYDARNKSYKYLNLVFYSVPKKFRLEIITLYIYHFRVITKARKYKIKRTLRRIKKEKRDGNRNLINLYGDGCDTWSTYCLYSELDI